MSLEHNKCWQFEHSLLSFLLIRSVTYKHIVKIQGGIMSLRVVLIYIYIQDFAPFHISRFVYWLFKYVQA